MRKRNHHHHRSSAAFLHMDIGVFSISPLSMLWCRVPIAVVGTMVDHSAGATSACEIVVAGLDYLRCEHPLKPKLAREPRLRKSTQVGRRAAKFRCCMRGHPREPGEDEHRKRSVDAEQHACRDGVSHKEWAP